MTVDESLNGEETKDNSHSSLKKNHKGRELQRIPPLTLPELTYDAAWRGGRLACSDKVKKGWELQVSRLGLKVWTGERF